MKQWDRAFSHCVLLEVEFITILLQDAIPSNLPTLNNNEFLNKAFTPFLNNSFIVSLTSDISYNFPYRSKLLEHGFIKEDDECSPWHRSSLFLFYPKPSIITSIQSTLNQANSKPIAGFQIRTGGSHANSKERAVFLKLDQIPQVCALINQYLNDQFFVYVSTDSNRVLYMINNCTNHRIHMMTGFKRGHSSAIHNKKNVGVSFEGAVCDLGVLSFSSILHYTSSSSYGQLASYMMKRYNASFVTQS